MLFVIHKGELIFESFYFSASLKRRRRKKEDVSALWLVWVKPAGPSIIHPSQKITDCTGGRSYKVVLLWWAPAPANACTVNVSRLWLRAALIFPNLDDQTFTVVRAFLTLKRKKKNISKPRNLWFWNGDLWVFLVCFVFFFSLSPSSVSIWPPPLLALSKDAWWIGYVIHFLVWKLLGNVPPPLFFFSLSSPSHTLTHRHTFLPLY